MVAFVGIPARGKTVMAHKLARYLNWTGEVAKVFTVSEYRRKLVEQYDSHDLFRADNREAMEIRKKSSVTAMEDAALWLKEEGNVAVLDGTNATKSQRENVYDYCAKLCCKVLFIESICDDDDILSRNIKEVLQNSPDYKDMAQEKAMDDFHHKIQHYLEQYEPINPKQEPNLRYIKIMNEGETISVRRVAGQIEGRILAFLSNFKPAPKTLYFSRHGESENNVLGRIGGDTNLSPRGRKYAQSLARHMNEVKIEGLKVWTSELCRTKQTAEGINAPAEHISALNELDAGVCEGLTYEGMQDKFPQEFAWRDQDKLRYRYPWGESYVDIMARLDPVLLELEHEDNVLVVSHQAVLRCILGYFLNKKPEELPYINVPLHTLIKITTDGYNCHMECTKLNVECVDTYRKQPKNCSADRTTDDALLTVPSHFDSLNFWQLTGQSSLITQH
ncbi:6-phosphofructo-2-kinase/fructose-2,6-bisphosphatase [Cryptotermes secundus]|uniref:6-phosphofructo-2-kinase/fructose-2, 6-bisphosphatase n=1 Tax=Cryptotermes secundus TaxID=105785 RepID=A0A2J7PT48_9NEOP|nr:6-phosphofructo-2-kinase/fructose-2,6-bisphosphatase [Cryptotermes secundus]PNF19507.1 6-phosphofructo-2-kinase/fructose-2,6-bisphosphatase [Cryptotermes secundus]PNF19508.1 6-phosphofructo-2-kinase/fructose-2,6-bisphosphatase [Cryptotermes secundus]